MAKTATANKLALDVPRSPIGLTFELLDLWKGLLEARDLEVSILPTNDEALSEERLSRTGGLVIACYNTRAIQLDEDNILHMRQAVQLGVPTFVQAEEWHEVAPAGVDSPPGETIFMHKHNKHIGMIKDRLEGEI